MNKPRKIKPPIIDLEEIEPGRMEQTETFAAQLMPQIKRANLADLGKTPILAPDPSRLFRTTGSRKILEDWSREEVRYAIDSYFAECTRVVTNEETGEDEYYYAKRPTLEGVAQSLGIQARALMTYRDHEKFGDLIQAAISIVQEALADMCASDCKNAGAMFLLGQMGYLRKDPPYIPADPRKNISSALTPEEIESAIDADIVD